MAELKDILHKINALCDSPEPYVLKRLIDTLRVSEAEFKTNSDLPNERIRELNSLLRQYPQYANGLAVFVLTLLNKYHRMSLYTDTGILSDQTFSNSLMRLIGHRFVPLLPEDDSIVELVAYLFDGKDDERWLASINDELWDELVDLIMVDDAHSNLVATAKNNILNALVILSYRVSGIGLHPDLMKAYPQMLDYSAAFVAQNQEAVLFANEYREIHQLDNYEDAVPGREIDPGPLLVMLEQCDNIVNTVRKRIYKTGISIRSTNMLLRLEQSLKRMHILSELLAKNDKNRDKAIVELTQAIIVSVKRRYSISYLIDNNTKLLSRKITENSGRVGEHYISTDKAGYKKMFKMAAVGGFMIAFMATTKILSYDLELAPMSRAFVNSMIYGLGFVFIHIIHGTVATKQPAMTAAAIASTISDSSGKKSHQLAKLSELMVDIIRTQFIAIMGNVMVAMPLALIISIVWLQVSGAPMIDTDQADHLLHDLDPFHSLAIFHAAIAGVFLFLSGLIAGYYDNLALFNNIGERISRHKFLLRFVSESGLRRFGIFVENNLGAIMGNFLFGVFLGSTATVGFIFGMPLDIRHIAFASANFSHGIFNIAADDLGFGIVLISLLGVALIGIVNLLVSFSLAMIVALRSKGVEVVEWKTLAKLMYTHLFTQPRDFFLPRPEPMKYAKIDSQGYMIHEETNKTQKNKLFPKHFAVRRLSSVRVIPEGTSIDTKRIDEMNEKNEFNKKLSSDKPLETVEKKVVNLDDKEFELLTPEVFESISDEGITIVSTEEDKTKNAKTPLPKPKNPPKLPE
ncbi:site-specific recombinase [Psychrobacter sanguinis]|uniref:site-specific recombinase n=1 Tax=Psychrobacter sanguinis TaxID=861445 RepID=UPI00020C792E|nr:site-specific recombinase [Psychrobacter sanguinis]EGK15089.1 site-specific recombinase family protein [Psychrobacter sp. 1501(2011)]MCD9151183.1 site-specific recombinase [Psychrobacter sanguinis]